MHLSLHFANPYNAHHIHAFFKCIRHSLYLHSIFWQHNIGEDSALGILSLRHSLCPHSLESNMKPNLCSLNQYAKKALIITKSSTIMEQMVVRVSP